MKRLFGSLSSLSAWVLQPLLILVILAVGFGAASQLSLRREPPQRSETAVYAPLVRAAPVARGAHAIRVRGNGSLAARTRIDLVPQVGGEVVEIHPGLRSGGRFRAGEMLLRIEPRDYELAVARAEAELSSAGTSVTTVRAESESAIVEWERLNPGEPCPPLVRLEPQILEAEARVLSARVGLETAQLDLARTELSLPFDGRVIESTVDAGEVLSANQSAGVVYATAVLEVAVPLRVGEVVWLGLPERLDAGGPEADGDPRPVLVRGVGAGGPFEVEGRIARVLAELDGTSRMARVVVEIRADELAASIADRLLPGTFVDVEFEGKTLNDVSMIPRSALRESGVVWLVEQDRIRFVQPVVLHRSNGTVLVEGLEPGALVVTSNLEVVTDGMHVRIETEEAR